MSAPGPGCVKTPFKSESPQDLRDSENLQFPKALISLMPKFMTLRQNQKIPTVRRRFHIATVMSGSQEVPASCLLLHKRTFHGPTVIHAIGPCADIKGKTRNLSLTH